MINKVGKGSRLSKCFVCSVTEWSIFRLLTVAQIVCSVFFDSKFYGFLLDFEVNKFMSSVAQRLGLGFAAEAPPVGLSCGFQCYN